MANLNPKDFKAKKSGTYYKSPLEGKFKKAMYMLRGKHSIIETGDQIDLAYAINKVKQYGFNFFPNMYIYDEIQLIWDMAVKYNDGKVS